MNSIRRTGTMMDDVCDEHPSTSQERDEPGEAFENAEALRESDAAVLVKFKGRERWVPKSQIHEDSEVYAKGHKGKLVVTDWFARKLEEDGGKEPTKNEDPVVIQDVVCLRESEKAILIRVGVDGEETWLPKGQVLNESEVQGDGDCGALHITAWIAKQKKLP